MAQRNEHRPKLDDVPQHRDVVSWLEPLPDIDGDDTWRFVRREQRVVRWACGTCKRNGRAYAGEIPPACPGCSAGWDHQTVGQELRAETEYGNTETVSRLLRLPIEQLGPVSSDELRRAECLIGRR